MSNWLPIGKNGNEEGWRLDIVSLLAVIGESSIEAHSQALTSSWTCILPRLIPAPQVLLKPSRPNRMPQANATVVGVHNGTMISTLNYFPNILHPIEDLPPLSFKVYKISHKRLVKDDVQLPDGSPTQSRPARSNGKEISTSSSADLESGPFQPPRRRATFQKLEQIAKKVIPKTKPRVPPKTFSPLNVLSVASSIVTVGLFITAALIHDGTACLALGTISIVSSIVGYASWWQPVLTKRTFSSKVPPGDVIIRTREGAFLLVRCNEDVARELYVGTEECEYFVQTQLYRVLVGIGTFMLMISVILLGNCNFVMQAAVASSYILLNGAFWTISLIDRSYFWDLSAYNIEDVTEADASSAHSEQRKGEENQTNEDTPSFTRTLWYAIRETKKIGWVKRGGAAPNTEQWDKWLAEAEKHAQAGNRTWEAVKERENTVGEVESTPQAETADEVDTAEQHIPATEVPPPDMK